MAAVAHLVAELRIAELLILLLSAAGSAVFIGLVLCVRRFDSKQGSDGHGKGGGGGGGRRPGPSRPVSPLSVLDPPLGEIRASRQRPHEKPRRRRERAAS